MVTIYQFVFHDTNSDGPVKSRRWGTRAAVEGMRGSVLEDTAIEIDEASVMWDPTITGLTGRDFQPHSSEPQRPD